MESGALYLPKATRLSREFFGMSLLEASSADNTVTFLEDLVGKLTEGLGKVSVYPMISMSNHHPEFLGWPIENLKSFLISSYASRARDPFEDAQVCLAREYGYQNWQEVKESPVQFTASFEQALKALLNGELQNLEALLRVETSLTQAISPFAHRATLLHYAASNGVEIWRQQVPNNLSEGVGLLLRYGANPKSVMKVYGGEFDVIALLDSSAHPKDAGCYEAVRAELPK
ncbi:hypothetical protein SAMN04490243_1417 [Robiginitalea myxolifaciens]|uniref:Uncharacterized protein n=1 Tax=Robiginitalea myxolifaciens TaxID=400055 RepID=A0A1I6G924_9FLAO|nr:hypothetical protein [Robiginitalea myxolifaciens]SFR38631.1 hypothetical protein SAMN04490243_1417 [Robiginitalea myxolifaciens]